MLGILYKPISEIVGFNLDLVIDSLTFFAVIALNLRSRL